MIAPADLDHCREVIRTGSLSFHAASKLLPAQVRDPALALYAFCRVADDEVDEGNAKGRAVLKLSERLDKVYAGKPQDAPEDRAFSAIVNEFDMPRALPDALLEGLSWDALERRYDSLEDLHSYCARVASAVGVMMCVLMRVREPNALARACDLGVAMQLTNIARDVGEDARAGRIYLPLDWLDAAGMTPDAFMKNPTATPEVRRMVARLLAEARRLYIRSEAGIGKLPPAARAGIFAARYVYAGIGTSLRRKGHDSISQRARTTKAEKLYLLGKSGVRAAGTVMLPTSPVLFARPLAAVQFLVDATAYPAEAEPASRMDGLISALATLKAQESGLDKGLAAE